MVKKGSKTKLMNFDPPIKSRFLPGEVSLIHPLLYNRILCRSNNILLLQALLINDNILK